MSQWARSIPARAFVAALVLALHLFAMARVARERMHLEFNSAPGQPVEFVPPDAALVGPTIPSNWNRLLPSRWDSQHYTAIVLRGYSLCPAEKLDKDTVGAKLVHCGFNFYPGYPAIASVLARGLRLPADFALFAVSMISSFFFLFLFTGRDLTDTLGVRRTYLALLLFNAFTTGFALVTNQTEPLTLLCALGAFIALRRKKLLLGALIAGLAGALRVTGGAVGVAYFAAAAWVLLREQKGSLGARFARLVAVGPLCEWGQLSLFGYFGLRYGDPLLYVHAHQSAYSHDVSVWSAFFPGHETALRALAMGQHEGLFIALAALWLALGLRDALSGFAAAERVYWYVLTVVSTGVGILGSSGLAYAGMNRYWLLVLPLFFSMATVLARRPVAIVVWLGFSLWHYYNVDLCVYVAQWSAASACSLGYTP